MYRLLDVYEKLLLGDEYYNKKWIPIEPDDVGDPVTGIFPIRRKMSVENSTAHNIDVDEKQNKDVCPNCKSCDTRIYKINDMIQFEYFLYKMRGIFYQLIVAQ